MKQKNDQKQFYTVRGYALLHRENDALTPSMEDYLEMVARLSKDKGYARIGDLSRALNVQPPSASKMVQKLAELNYLNYEKYGIIELTTKGNELGDYLLQRHESIEQFLKIIGVTEGVLEETEKIEHNISEMTMLRIRILVDFMLDDEKRLKKFLAYLEDNLV
ncbi:transcriptional regulator MntR [Metallumcola ferriviriculae]|uniref:Manganese transport regulator n=1 Tax=Metallumcola ferriviriculae TaxID=3039180 RepID=A0AAU0UJH3_9FIRM|nr:transcriptional regulator MntR [Desulfitibacteraceae bacterium MK1]